MRVMVIVPADKSSEAGMLPDRQILSAMGKFNEELVKAGVMLAGEGLQPTSKGKRVKFSGGTPAVIDGPFTESKELVAGFWLWQVKSMDEAVEWLKRAPFGGGTVIEIRRVFETEDFGNNLTPEMKASEDRMRAQSTQEEMTKMGQLIGEMMQAGVLLSTEGCKSSKHGARVKINKQPSPQ